MGDTKTPAAISALAVGVNIAFCLALKDPMGFRGLALATAISATVNLALLVALLTRRIGRLDFRDLAEGTLKVAACSAISAGTLLGARALWPWVPDAPLPAQIANLAVLLAAAGGAYLLSSSLLRVKELGLLFGLVRRRH